MNTKDTSPSQSEQILTSTVPNTPQANIEQPIVNQTDKLQTPAVTADVNPTQLDSERSETKEHLNTTQIIDKNAVTIVHKTKEIDEKNKLSITDPETVNTNKKVEKLNSEQTVLAEGEEIAQLVEDKKHINQQKNTTQKELSKSSSFQESIEVNNKNYIVTPKTHKATETALLKAELFDQEIVNLPKLPEKKVNTRSVKAPIKTQKRISPKLTTSTTTLNKTVNNKSLANTNVKSAVKTAKPTFKPKVDTELLNLSNSIKLPEAVAISGKKPNYVGKVQKKGQVVASMTVLPTGNTKEAEIVKSSGDKELDQAVIEFISEERFMPSLDGQDKVSSKQIFSFSYE